MIRWNGTPSYLPALDNSMKFLVVSGTSSVNNLILMLPLSVSRVTIVSPLFGPAVCILLGVLVDIDGGLVVLESSFSASTGDFWYPPIATMERSAPVPKPTMISLFMERVNYTTAK